MCESFRSHLYTQNVNTGKWKNYYISPVIESPSYLKRIRKRHILVDTTGLLLMVIVHAANIQDRDGAKLVLEQIKGTFSRLQLIWADAAYAGQLVDWVKITCGWVLEIIYEGLTEYSQAFIYAAMIHIMSRRLAKIEPLSR
ncbi:Mobile element protein [Methanosarcina siciliae C2J]|uniref:Mobile element protein n=1 Tax=Methanosarcina siciliae C2J TaxID=1434118 RepID=A0A0E3PMQ8_9EURY|nr:Mobile element protein [Methanosarcina siciliae C2J]